MMQFVRQALAMVALVAVTTAGLPGSVAAAAVDTDEIVSGLASEAALLIAQERELLELARSGDEHSATELAAARSSLRTVDAEAVEVLRQLDLLGVDVSNAVRAAMSSLPAPGDSSAETAPPLPPPAVVYDAAIDDLMRIAATPAASTPVDRTGEGGSFGLLAVAAVALLALGLAALSNTLRRTGDDHDLAAMAWSDGLTGVANRRRLDRDLAHRSASGEEPTAVIMLDVDHFKSVNDVHGHQAGDDVLRSIGRLLAEQVRHDDIVYRYGGEEFCILLPSANKSDARAIADRIVTAARSITLPDGSHITVSVGVADGTSDALVSTLETADRAMYAAKSGGRDRTAAGPEPATAADSLEAV